MITRILDFEKPIVELDPTVFEFKRGKKKKLPNLNKTIVYIPENTIMKSELNVSGNIVNIRKLLYLGPALQGLFMSAIM